MKLRSSLRLQQLLFTLLLAAVCLFAGDALAQVDATIVFKAPPPPQPQPPALAAKVVNVSGSALMVHDQFGERGIPLSQIQEVQMREPPEVQIAQSAFNAKDFTKALSVARALVEKWNALPAGWAANMSSLIGDIYLEQGDLAKASAAYDDFAKAYPGNGGADLGRARIAVAKKDYDTARKTAEKLSAEALKKVNVTRSEGELYGQAFLVLGQIKEAQGDFQGALEDYLRTVTLFYHNPTALALAKDRADAIRKAHLAFVP
jgi:tetratricopeptide (TPR) repeat protein